MKLRSIRTSYIAAIALILSACVSAQELPQKIRGYKLHNSVIHAGEKESRKSENRTVDASIKIGEVTIGDVGLTGITIEAIASITAFGQNGRVDFLIFRDFRVNGLAVEIEEFKHSFSFKRGQQVALPVPVRVFIRGTGIAKAAFRELIGSKSEWAITGRVFIFGKFKKFGFNFKRAIPCQIELKIPSRIKS